MATRLAETSRVGGYRSTGRALDEPERISEDQMAALVADTGGILSSDEVARLALLGLTEGRFFVFTHKHAGRFALERNEELAQEMEKLV